MLRILYIHGHADVSCFIKNQSSLYLRSEDSCLVVGRSTNRP
jgi:hypothetical protein